MSETTKKYIEAVGRRKTSIARARLTPSTKTSFVVNEKPIEEYFKVAQYVHTATSSINQPNTDHKFTVSVRVTGGGSSSQADAVRHAIARALLKHDITLRGSLKKAGFLKRDPRAKERRKFGLKKARKAPQWSKR
jgi:small subunit ribosomal protein S9